MNYGIRKRIVLIPTLMICLINHLFSGIAPGQTVNIEDRQKILEWSNVEEHTLALSGLFYDDAVYQDYVSEIGQKLIKHIPNAENMNFNFHTIRNPYLNAFAMATGAIYVHTGLVTRLENEAQLAGVIAHEITHSLKQHPVLGYSHSKSRTAGYQMLSIGASVAFALVGGRGAGAYIGDQFAQLGLVLMTSASISGYSRDMEQEADMDGLEWVSAAGYDPAEVPKVFELFMNEYGDPGKVGNYFWGDHPRNTTRMKYLNEEIQKKNPGGKSRSGYLGAEEYRARINILLREDARLNIESGLFHTALAELDTFLRRTPGDPAAFYYKGLAYQSMSEDPDTLSMAKEMFDRSMGIDPTYAMPYRILGYIAEKDSLAEEAVSGYERYLALKPDAKDRMFIRWKIEKLKESSEGLRDEEAEGGVR